MFHILVFFLDDQTLSEHFCNVQIESIFLVFIGFLFRNFFHIIILLLLYIILFLLIFLLLLTFLFPIEAFEFLRKKGFDRNLHEKTPHFIQTYKRSSQYLIVLRKMQEKLNMCVFSHKRVDLCFSLLVLGFEIEHNDRFISLRNVQLFE
jgi:hypothetical protein